MTIATEVSKNSYDGNGSTTVFAYAFRIEDEDHLEVIVADADDTQTTLTITTHYTVSGVGEASGGNVTTEDLTAITGEEDLPSGWTIVINREVPITQSTALTNQGPFYPATIEDVFDYLTMISQQLQEQLDRAPKLSITSGETGDEYIEALQEAVVDAEAAQAAAEVAETNAETAETNAEAAQVAAEAAAAGVNLPSIEAGDAGKTLAVNGAEDGYELIDEVETGITASTTQTQGQQPLTAKFNEISVCANANDTVTLPSAAAGFRITILNNGANILRIYPASGDNLGNGVNTLGNLGAGDSVTLIAYDATNWVTEKKVITRIIAMGTWDMDATANIAVNHNLDHSKIRSVTATIRSDAGGQYPISGAQTAGTVPDGYLSAVTSTQVGVYRVGSGTFDNVAFDDTGISRGNIVIEYVL